MIEISGHRVSQKHDPANSFIPEGVEAKPMGEHPLECAETKARLDKVKIWRHQAISSQYEVRERMAKAERFYDNDQWSKEDKEELEGRGQPALVFNKIKPTINWILGTERKSRVEAKVLARNKEKTSSAEAKTKLLKYIDDVNMTAYHRSRAFSDAAIAGVGWLETGVRSGSDEPLYVERVSWRDIWYDNLHTKLDYTDARYLIRQRWTDLDIAQAMFPDRAAELETEAHNVTRLFPQGFDDTDGRGAGSYDEITGRSSYQGGEFHEDDISVASNRPRVQLIEVWYKEIAKCQCLHCEGSPLHNSVLNESDNHQRFAVEQGFATLVDAVKPVMRVMIYCGSTVLFDGPSPYRHNRFPFVPIWCYRKGADNSPYGIVDGIIDPQEDLNKRKSKALYILSSNKFIADDNASENWNEFRAEANRPDGIIRVMPNSRVVPLNETQIAREQLDLAKDDERFIQDVSGVTDENMGRDTRAESGVAIRSKQTQGLVATSLVFDNLNLAVQLCGELEISLIEQYYDAPKIVRLLNDKNAASYLEVNGDDGNITDDKADFIVTQQDLRDSIRQGMFEMMSEFTTRLDPQTALNMLDLVVDMSDLPGREQLVARIRKMNGQTDPDAAVTPEEERANAVKEEQMAAEEAKQKEFVERMQELEAKTKEAELAVNAAKLEKLQAEAVVKSVEALYASMQAAQTAATVPGVVPIADGIAKSAGFVDKNQGSIYPEPQAPAVATPPNQGQWDGGISSQPDEGIVEPRENTSPMYPGNATTAGEGMLGGIETPTNDGGI